MNYQALWEYVKEWLSVLLTFSRLLFTSKLKMQLEIIALRSNLALVHQDIKAGKRPKPKATPAFRQLWVFLSKYYPDWESVSVLFQPATVKKWHEQIRKWRWAKKSKRIGRPPISQEVIDRIKEIHQGNTLLSPEKIREELLLLNVTDAPAPNTIAKYLPTTKKPPSPKKLIQLWLTFLKNHAPDTWGADFFTVSTLFFKIHYVLVIINHGTRKIKHIAVTTNPNVF